MIWQSVYLITIFSASAISLGIAVYAWKNRRGQGVLSLAGMMLAVAGWLFTSGLVSTSQTPEQERAWVNPRYFMLTAMLAFFITFAIKYTGREKWLTKTRLALIFAIPLVTQIIIETNPWHHLFLVDVHFSPDGMLMGLDSVVYGFAFWFHTIYSYSLALIGIGLIAQMSIHTFPLYREQAIILIIGILPPLLTSVIDAFLLIPGLKHPLAPLGFAFMGLAFAWTIFRRRMLDIVPVARDKVIESMSDSLIVLDSHENIVDINLSALQLLGAESSQIIGKPAAQVFHRWHEVVEQYRGQAYTECDMMLPVDGLDRWFDLRASPLIDRHGRSNGRMIILRDITLRKQTEDQLRETLSTITSLQEQLYEQAVRDQLTGLYNRRFFNEIISRELARAIRESYPISFVMMDLDHYKSINDTYGHEVGDLVLQELAMLLTRQTRAGDVVFRYGGEEFLALLPATDLQSAYHYAERWRLSLQDTNIRAAKHDIHITMSIGIAAFTSQHEKYQDILAAADTALYRAKASGRNCTIVFRAATEEV